MKTSLLSVLKSKIKTAGNIVFKRYCLIVFNKLFGGKYICPVCSSKIFRFESLPNYFIDKFSKYGFIHSIFALETYNIQHCLCPICHTNDSKRLYAIYLHKKLNELSKKNKYFFLDIAPIPELTRLIKSYKHIEYRSADLYNKMADDQVDIRDMKIYADNHFDIILCTHVLEHIDQDLKAMQEIYRVLKTGGTAIVQVPILTTISENYENCAITDQAGRWKHFGQSDHLRIYSRNGFVNKLAKAGFKVHILDIDYFGAETFEKHGISKTSALYTVTK